MSTKSPAAVAWTLPPAALAIFLRELRAEFRTRELLNTTVVFVLIIVVMFSFSLNPSAQQAREFGPGLLWLAFLFAGSLMLQPAFTRELASDTISSLRMAPIDPSAILFGKVAANFFFLTFAEWLMLPVFGVLFNVPVWPVVGPLAMVLGLGTLGVCVAGTAFSAMTAQARLRELLLPLLLLPFLAPVLVAAVDATSGLFAEVPELRFTPLKILAAFDVIFLTAAWLLFENLIEE